MGSEKRRVWGWTRPLPSSALGLQGVEEAPPGAGYHRGDWEIKADCVE